MNKNKYNYPADKSKMYRILQTQLTGLIDGIPHLTANLGHIACDSASNSEIVIPLHNARGKVVGVLDIDSPSLSRFDEVDKDGLLLFAKILEDIF